MSEVYWFICAREAYPAALPRVAANQASFNRATANAIAAVMKARHGIGDLLLRPVPKAIPGHLLCDGTAVRRDTFNLLFAEIGTKWGAGDGATTFNLPNLIGVDLPTATEAPAQVITDSTVSSGETITEPATTGQTGGSTGGNITTGGRPTPLSLDIPLD